MKLIKMFVLVALVNIIFGCETKQNKNDKIIAQNDEIDNPIDKIENYLSQLNEIGFSGAVLFAKKDNVLLSKGYGYSDREKKLKNSSKTVFDIGSVTKQFTAAAILKLEMQSKISVNDKIAKYFNNIPEDKKEITIHHLLTHSSGLLSGIADDYDEITTDDFIKKVFDQKLLFIPGKAYEYSNVGYSLLGIIIEKVSNKTYENYLFENLWQPAKMERTGYTRPNFIDQNVSIGYNKKNEPLGKPNKQQWDNDAPYWHLKANGGVLSTIDDMYKWHQALRGENVLSIEAKKKYFKPYIKEGDAQSYYGYGWAMYETSRGTTLAAHNGGNGIFFADFWRYLDDDMTIIILNNNSTPYSQIIASQIGALYFLKDFKPRFPSQNSSSELDESEVKTLVERAVNVLNQNSEEKWKNFIVENGSSNFINMAPIELHLKYFTKFHNKLKGGKLVRFEIDMDEAIASIKTPTGIETLVINVEPNNEGKLQFGGIMIE